MPPQSGLTCWGDKFASSLGYSSVCLRLLFWTAWCYVQDAGGAGQEAGEICECLASPTAQSRAPTASLEESHSARGGGQYIVNALLCQPFSLFIIRLFKKNKKQNNCSSSLSVPLLVPAAKVAPHGCGCW